jgi:hypothetical protein
MNETGLSITFEKQPLCDLVASILYPCECSQNRELLHGVKLEIGTPMRTRFQLQEMIQRINPQNKTVLRVQFVRQGSLVNHSPL